MFPDKPTAPIPTTPAPNPIPCPRPSTNSSCFVIADD